MTVLSSNLPSGDTGKAANKVASHRLSALVAVDNPSGATSLRRSVESLGWECREIDNRREFEACSPNGDYALHIIALDFDGCCGVRLAKRLTEDGVPKRIAFWSPNAHIPASRLSAVSGFADAELLVGEISSDHLARAASSSLPAGAEDGGGEASSGHSAEVNGYHKESNNVAGSPYAQDQAPTSSAAGGSAVTSPSASRYGSHGRRSPLADVILGGSRAMQEVRRTIEEVGPTRATVLVSGPSGTGKELVARSIHSLSRHKTGPFVPVNLAAIPEGLAESQLFGHEKGAFTNAVNRHAGFCRAAHNGTLFLDEISEMPIAVQPKLLRFMQEKTIQTVGSTSEQKVDLRVVSAMNRDPATVVRQGHLREDLYFRLNVVPIRIPPLHERRDDIEDLAVAFLRRTADYHEREVRGFTPAAIDVLSQFDWPGNVRQLENAIERIVIFCRGAVVDALDIPAEFHGASIAPPAATETPACSIEEPAPAAAAKPTPLTAMQKKERETIVEALQNTDGHVIDAANLLGIGQATLYRKLKQYNISRGPRRRRKSPK